MRIRVALAGVVVLCLCGCSWRFTRLPTENELYRPVDEVYTAFPELEKCRPDFGRLFLYAIWDAPYAEDLTAAWGEPDDHGLSWWNLTPFAMVPPFHPYTYWQWEKANKTITAIIDHPLGYGYEAHVWLIDIEESTSPRKAPAPPTETTPTLPVVEPIAGTPRPVEHDSDVHGVLDEVDRMNQRLYPLPRGD